MIKRFRLFIDRLFSPVQPLPAGTFPYQSPPDAPVPYRLHLRLQPNGEGMLIVNASTMLHLNQTAAEYAYHLVKCTPPEQVAAVIARRYNVSQAQALQDFNDLRGRIESLIHTPDLDPEIFLGFERVSPYSTDILAPYRLDCALTYRLNEGIDPALAPTARVTRELDSAEWQSILKKAWDAGIPHIIFTGGEATLRPDLPDLVAYAESLGQVTGLLTDGLRLQDGDYLRSLLQSGLDHLMLILDPANPAAWQALQNALAEDIFITVHLTMTPANQDELPALLPRLAQMGVKSLSLSLADPDLQPELKSLTSDAARAGLALTWDLPVPYSSMHPVALELEEIEDESASAFSGHGRAWMYVEPDGDVLPAQGIEKVLGNLLNAPWEAIRAASLKD